MKILVVDDESVARAMLVQVLGQLGYQVVESSSAVEALKIIQQNSISIVITDWMMPEIDGIELCRQIRSVNKQHYTYIIMLTSKDSREDKLEGLQSGVDDLLTKPLDRGELLARLEVAKRIIRMETTLRQNAEQLITSKKQLESLSILLEQSSRRFEDLFDGIPVACFTTDNEGCVYEWNQACERLYGHSGDQVLSRVIWDFICAPEHKRAYKKFHKKVFSGQTVDEYERIDIGAGGIKRNILSQMIPLRGYDQSIVGAIVANVDITDRKKSEQRILEEMMRANQYSKELEKNKKELEKANSQLSELAII
jgi:PAS domain S-box-containing protein